MKRQVKVNTLTVFGVSQVMIRNLQQMSLILIPNASKASDE